MKNFSKKVLTNEKGFDILYSQGTNKQLSEREEMKMKTYTIKVVTNKRTVFEKVEAESLEMAKKLAILRVMFQW